MFKKILSCVLLALFLLQTSSVFALEYSSKALMLARSELQSTKNGKKYLSQLDTALPQMTRERLETIHTRVTALVSVSSSQKALIQYLDLAVQKEILSRSTGISAPESTQVSLTLAEIRDIENEIIAAQKLLQENIEQSASTLSKNWDRMTQYEEKGNMTFDFDMDIAALGTIDSGFSLKNYTAKQKTFDQQLTGEFEAFINASFQGQDIKAQGKSLIDFISQEGNIYLLAQKLETSFEPSAIQESFGTNDIITKLKELANSKTYIKFSNPESQKSLEVLKQFSPESALSESGLILSKALFTPIAKKSESYVLIPTKHLCDSIKALSGVFDPLGGKTCSDSQYKEMLADMQESGIEILYTPGTTKKIQVLLNTVSAKGDMVFQWNDTKLLSVTTKIVDPRKPLSNSLNLSFVPQSSLKMMFRADESISLDLTASFNAEQVQSLLFIANIEDTLTGKIDYKNNALSATLSFEENSGNFNCTLKGPLTQNLSDLSGGCQMDLPDDVGAIFGESQAELLYSFKSDTRDQKNNVSFSLSGLIDTKEILKLVVSNTATRNTDAKVNITAPTKTIELEKVMEDISEMGY